MKNKLFIGIIACLTMAILQQSCKSNTENKQAGKSMVNTVSDTEKSGQLSGTNVQHDTENQDKEKATHLQALHNEEVPDEPPPTQEELRGNGGLGYEDTPKQDTPTNNEVIVIAEQPPQFNGDINEYLKKNIKYPPMAKENNIEGRVLVQFVVNENGTIEKNSISFVGRNMGWGLPEEAIRVVSNMPPWKPAKQNGKNIKMKYTLPVVFKLP